MDWRTCKRNEADIIYNLHFYVVELIPPDLLHEEVIYDWTLFGKFWLLDANEYELYAQLRPPLIPPRDNMEDYVAWYSHRIQWLNG